MEYQEKIQLQLEESQSKLQKQDKNNEICNAEVDKLVRFVNASSCIPFANSPGIYKIQVSGVDFFDVLCDSQLAGPGWVVIQQRVGGKKRFNRDWATYREGFGSMDSDFFLGLEKIFRLSNSRRHELYVHLVELNGTIYYARYDDFKISDENNGYALSLGGFMGNVSDAMRISENLKFITFDRGDDKRCADHYKSGWWYKSCYNCNLNAVYGTNFNWYLILF
ncbi:ficolin-1-A-like [Drosophila nasuta]|uniref:ficolin-1-A-like n=1 Tax=Drosophila nasuta TaxID=42062 RepID=UPI00295F431F|nr:ficolin-1-A-like [Drosophila nasuta]XP_060655163.1 ficolin-1-A-like [Drosophila nasuta]